jgi:hypothetical protein
LRDVCHDATSWFAHQYTARAPHSRTGEAELRAPLHPPYFSFKSTEASPRDGEPEIINEIAEGRFRPYTLRNLTI